MNIKNEEFCGKFEALILFISILFIIGISILKFEAAPQAPILFSIILLLGFGLAKKVPWSYMENGIKKMVETGLIPIFIFILIGGLIGILIASGTISTLIYFGFKLISAKYFLASVFIISAIVGTSIGSAFTTAATVGVAFLAIGEVLGFNLAIVAGAVVSGAFFGDKMSPLSDTTNLAATVGKVDLFVHIKNMMWTTIPAFLIALTFYFFLGGKHDEMSMEKINEFTATLSQVSTIHWATLIPIIIMIVLSIKKVPAILTLLTAILSGIIVLFIFEPQTTFSQLMSIIQDGYQIETKNEEINSLLNRGGIQSMMWSVSLILLTLAMGGLLATLGVIEQLMLAAGKFIQTTGKLIFSTALSAIGINVLVGEQYLSIILTGSAFSKKFENMNIATKNLSRVLEDAGTVINPLIPYGISGVFLTTVLGVDTLSYLPFAIFCWLCPILTVIYGFTGIGIFKHNADDTASPLTESKIS